MKVQTLKSLLTGILCTTGVLATIETIYNNDGSIHAIQSFPDGGSHLNKRGCTSNNCLRAMVARPDAATSFCNAFTTAVSSGVAPFTQCVGAAKASSACSCLVPKPTTMSTSTSSTSTSTSSTSTSTEPPAPTCLPPGGHCTIEDFIDVCCPQNGIYACSFPTGDPEDGVCY
ncbi:hypothetical protein DL546_008244 [Coniochaeta pulveracea]|uniref:Uncharacterized protein n=1 Tax=Coniochaeta pulveracea TaxID=177199 RepID=A0A420YMP2_9PEZI|nr:hypothetical protein DL546_008244 [Coniochaeta pulveracea]